jgi:S-adenosylmethionine hydrolase
VARPLIALLTDFGLRDHYVGTMKGVVLGICPEATLVDIAHDLPPHDVQAGAMELAAAYPYFPPGTIFLVVVDPGVGTTRRGIAAESGAHKFVAPDNGILSAAFTESAPARVVELSNPRYALRAVSRTFEGRDRFAPAAAWLAAGVDLAALGSPVDAWTRLELPAPCVSADAVEGEVVRVDRFGNLVTNIDRRMFEVFRIPVRVSASIDGRGLLRVVSTYADVAAGEVCALFGSSGHLEIAANGASAAEVLGAARGARVRIKERILPESA